MDDKENYCQKQLANPFKCDILHLINNIKNNKRVIFTKFGDGEYACIQYKKIDLGDHNCDNDNYSVELGNRILKSFNNLCYLSKTDDGIYIGKWHSNEKYMKDLCSKFYDYFKEINSNDIIDIPFVYYHFCYNDHYEEWGSNKNLYEFVKTIQNSNKNKIVITNYQNTRFSIIFKPNYFVTISPNSWFESSYEEIYNYVSGILNKNEDSIILLSAGLASKVLINELANIYPKASFIDIGSGFDLLARKRPSRTYYTDKQHSYFDEYMYYKDLLPPDFL